ncbi:SusC family [Proteiniphilum saccharofermentans]|uniref:SusC family n=1 Tax=Proteiniphilum saccharofermentans TaxID=1642647 RepID=A0A1R3SRX6_9BACT|nr:TonB-dependent receptor [Proteiniphilum saccharofermentans]SCD19146.1 SusC family [Proteiniphilum saccharofermentans]SDZ73397.1 TonB-linked outer membrane protein, SusC/RagA family [Porphyromonadaceae bacterium KH3R12]SFL28846.1 TonB-linked outer membrane protein, SusC/RagA family [Porphyromonadaceae bacterium KH3CP3RA]
MKECKKCILRTVVFVCCVFFGLSGFVASAHGSYDMENNNSAQTNPLVSHQKKRIKGSVTDDSGEPLIGVNIVEKGTTNGTITDINGLFTLDVAEGSNLVVSYVGFEDKEIVIDSKTEYYILLSESILGIDEVVIVGYGTMKKQNLTGAVSAVKFDEAMTSRPTLNLSSALTGLSAGLNISQLSGTPGAENVNIMVRGRGTMNDSSPLVIIDGVPGALNDVNPNDVESVSVLKDAASSAIYGSRAANGVILVTTKRGSEEKVNVTYNGYVGWQNAANNIEFISDMATHMEMVNAAYGREQFPNNLIEEWRLESAKGNPLYPNTNWYDEMLNTSVLTEHNLTIRGGNNKNNFSLSAGYLDNKGIIDNSGYKKYSFRLSADSKVNNWLDIGGNVFGSWSDRDPIDVIQFFNLIKNTTPGVIPKSEDGRYGREMFPGLAIGKNPRAYVDNIRGNYERQKLGLKVYKKIKFLKYMEWESSFGFNFDNRRNWEYYRPYTVWNFQTETEESGGLNEDKLFNGSQRNYTTIVNTLLRFNYSLNKEHNFAALVGFDQQYNRMDKFNATKEDILGDDAIYIMDAGVLMSSIEGSGTDDALRSYFGRINYDYKGKYLFEANSRYDGSSRFSKDNRWGFFPSFSAGWRVSEESFAQFLKTIFDDFKIRGSWGKLGNNRIGDYAYQAIYNSLKYPFGGSLQQGVAPTALSNSKIKWETTTMTNIGLDLVLLKNKLSLSAEYYNKTTNDILTTIPVPYVLGNLTAPWQNIAEMSNKGVELQLTYYGNIGKDFSYSINGNLSTINNEVVKYGDESISGATIIKEGSPYGAFYVLEFDRIIQNQTEIDQLLAEGYSFSTDLGGTPKPGDILYKDTNGDKVFDREDRVIKDYSTLPKMTYGININTAYKGLDFSIVGHGVTGSKGYWGQDGINSFNINEGFLLRTNVLDHWTPENRSTKYPRLQIAGTSNTYYSDYWLYDTSYFRIKSIQLGYSLPKRMISKFQIERLRIYANLENYFTFTSFEGYNPENTSMDYPLMKQCVIGLNLTF